MVSANPWPEWNGLMLKRLSLFKVVLVFAGILSLIAILAVWFLGPDNGLSRNTIILVITAILVAWISFLVLQFVARRRRSAQSARQFSRSQAGVGPMSSESTEAISLGGRLARTVQWLKKSKLAEAGRDAVYELPWYIVVGPQGSGKSSIIAQSGFTFSYTDPKRSAGKSDILPTATCDLWVANEALFIDSSGKYLAREDSIRLWRDTLDQIKKHRKAKPIDGLVLVMDTVSLLGLDDEALRAEADRIRAFLDLATVEFGMVFPIYLLFNKCDLIEGFQEFFSDLDGREESPLGATFSRDQYQEPHPEKAFEAELEQICQSLVSHRTAFLMGRPERNFEKIFAFPKQLSLLKERLSEFVGILFQPSQFRERPLFRGFYFTSAMQGGQHLNLVADQIYSKTGLPKPENPDQSRGVKSYFIHPLLSRVILPDRQLAGLSSQVIRRRILIRMVVASFVGVILPLILLLLAWGAYRDNHGLLDSIELTREMSIEDGKSSENLLARGELRRSLETMDCRGQVDSCRTNGRSFHWGLFAGDDVLGGARKIYLERLRQLFLDQLLNGDTDLGHTYNGLKTQLRLMTAAPVPLPIDEEVSVSNGPEFDPVQAYTLLKTFLMVTDETRADSAFLNEQIGEYWSQGVQEEDLAEADELLRFYLHQLGDHENSDYRLTRSLADEELASRVRELLLTVDPDIYYYGSIQEEGSYKLNSINLAGIAGVETAEILDAGSEVEGTYTKVGWETLVKDRIVDMKSDYEAERSWVLGISAAEPGQPKIDEKLRAYYFRDYRENWWSFLGGIGVVPFSNFRDASEKLALLSDTRESPLSALLETTSVNTWENLGASDLEDADDLQNVLNRGSAGQREVAEDFQSIHNFVRTGEDQESALMQYLKAVSALQVVIRSYLDANQPAAQVSEIGREAEAALRITNSLLVSFDAESRASIEPLLKQPIQHVLTIVDRTTPVGTVQQRKRSLILGGIVREKKKALDGRTVLLLEASGDSKYEADREIMRTRTAEGVFRFPNPVNPGSFTICVTKDEKNYYCGDVRVGRENDGKVYELKRPRSKIIFGGGKRLLTLKVE